MSEGSSPPIPLIVGALVGVAVLVGVGVAMMGGSSDSGDQTLAVQPPPGGVPTGAAPGKSQPAPERVDPKVPDPDAAEGQEPFALRMARRLLREEDESAALDVLESYEAEEGPEAATLRLREAIVARCDELIVRLRGELSAIAASGGYSAGQAQLASLRRRLPGSYSRDLDKLAEVLGTPPKIDLAAARAEYGKRVTALAKTPTPEGYYELALWARDRGLAKECQNCLERVVQLDGFHASARKALGHKKHEGRWYSDDEYKRQVLGLVKNADGRWVKPAPKAPVAVAKKVKPKLPSLPLPPPAPHQEDKEWYKDPEAKVAEWKDAKTYDSKYYQITTNVKQLYARRYCKMMDQYFKRFKDVFKNFLPPVKYEKSKIYIHSSKKEFNKENPQVPKTAGGFYQPKTKRVVCYHGLFGKQGTTRTVLAHEGTHQFEDIVLRGKFWNCPIWMIEGLAVFFESAFYKNGKVRIGLVPRERLYSLKRGLQKNALIPLRKLIRTPQRQFGGYHYAHAWSLIYMVVYGSKSKKTRARNQKWFSDLFMDALKGKVAPNAVEKKLGGKEAFDELEKAWKEWLAELPYDFDPKKKR